MTHTYTLTHTHIHTPTPTPGADILARDFWGNRQKHFLTLRYLIFLPSLIKSSLSHRATHIMRNQKGECTNKELSKWNMVPSLPLCLVLRVEWADWPPSSIRGLHLCLLPKDNSPMLQQWAGYAANCPSHYFARQSFT